MSQINRDIIEQELLGNKPHQVPNLKTYLNIFLQDTDDLENLNAMRLILGLQELITTEGIQDEYLGDLYGVSCENIIQSHFLDTYINHFYLKLDTKQRKDFIASLLQYTKPNHLEKLNPILDPENYNLIINLAIFDAIEDEHKYEYADSSLVLGYIQHYQNVPFEYVKETLYKYQDSYGGISLQHNQPVYNCLKNMQKNGYYINATPTQIAQIITDCSSQRFPESTRFCQGLCSTLSQSSLMKYLQTKPEKNIFYCTNALTPGSLHELLDTIQDETYKAKMMLSIKPHSEIIPEFFSHIEDLYVCEQISKYQLSAVYGNRNISPITYLQKINEYMNIKKTFEKVLQEEGEMSAALYLTSLAPNQNEGREEGQKDLDSIKYSLLTLLEQSKTRKVISDSFFIKCDDGNLKEYVEVATKMIQEFFLDCCHLSDFEQEKLMIAMKTYSISYRNIAHARLDHIQKRFEISENLQPNSDLLSGSQYEKQEELLLTLLHGYGTILSKFDFLNTQYEFDDGIEHGMGEMFAEKVANHYFSKHKEGLFNGVNIFYPREGQVKHSTIYCNEQTIIHAMIDPIQDTSLSNIFYQYYFDKNTFLNTTLGQEFTSAIPRDFAGNPLVINLPIKTIVTNFQDNPNELMNAMKTSIEQTKHQLEDKRNEKEEIINPLQYLKDLSIRYGTIMAMKMLSQQDYNKEERRTMTPNLYQRVEERAKERLKGIISEDKVGYRGYLHEEIKKICQEENIELVVDEKGKEIF